MANSEIKEFIQIMMQKLENVEKVVSELKERDEEKSKFLNNQGNQLTEAFE